MGQPWDVFLMKTDTFGEPVSFYYFGGLDTDIANCIRETNDGGYILAGNTWSYSAGSSDLYLIRTDSRGDTLWTNSFGGDEVDFGESVDVTSDGGFIAAGVTDSFGHFNLYLVRTDSTGDSLWTMVIDGDELDWGYGVQQTDDGGFIVGGSTQSISTTGGFYIFGCFLCYSYISPFLYLVTNIFGAFRN